MFVKTCQTIVVCALLAFTQAADGTAERTCQWLPAGICEPNLALLHTLATEYSCADTTNTLSDCTSVDTSSAIVAQGALKSCLATDSDAFKIYQCMTYDSNECQQNSQFCELNSDSVCTVNAAAKSELLNGDVIASSVDHQMDQIVFCDEYAATFQTCLKLETQDECLVQEGCGWYENVPVVNGETSGCLPKSVPVEIMPYRSQHQELISGMSKCSGIAEESACYGEVYGSNTNAQNPYPIVGGNSGDDEGMMNPAVIVALCIAVGSVLAMVAGILFVVYVHRNMMKYQELMRKLGIDPTDISLTDFSPLLDGEDEETSKMLTATKSDSSNSKEDDNMC